MGIDPNLLPEHVQRQIRGKSKNDSPRVKAKAVPHDTRMNKTETAYAGHLEKLKIAGEIADWRHEPFNIRLADRTFYKPDFAVVTSEGFIEIHEVKGYAFRDDALVKIKTAAEHLPWFTFIAAFWKNRQWTYRRF
jgi:hypothetical protein